MGKTLNQYIYKTEYKYGLVLIHRYRLINYNPAEHYIEYEDRPSGHIVKMCDDWIGATVYFTIRDAKKDLHDSYPKIRIYKSSCRLYVGIDKDDRY